MMPAARWHWALAAAMAVLVVSGTPPASAHAVLLGSDPPAGALLSRAPAEVRLWFSEDLAPALSSVVVYDQGRNRVDVGDGRVLEDRLSMVASLPDLPEGIYIIVWKALSDVDGHTTVGTVPFGVGVAPAPDIGLEAGTEAARSPLGAMLRGLQLVGALALLGSLVFRRLVLAPALASARLGRPALAGELWDAAGRALRLPVVGAGVALLAGGAGVLVTQALAAAEGGQGSDAGLLFVQTITTRWGALGLARLLLATALVALVWLALGTRAGRKDRRQMETLGIAAGAALLLTLSLAGHNAAGKGPVEQAGMVADWLHLLAAAAWVGGLVHLALVLPLAARRLARPQQVQLLGSVVPRFTGLAVLSVSVLIATGTYQAWLLVGSWAALLTPGYGLVLLLKLLLLLPALALGAVNSLLMGRAFGRATSPNPSLLRRGTDRARREAVALEPGFRVAVWLELLTLTVILFLAGGLTALAPPRSPGQVTGLLVRAQLDELRAELAVVPGLPGLNGYDVQLRDAGGRPVLAERVVLRLAFLEEDLGVAEAPLMPVGEGRFRGSGSELSVLGRWQAEILVRRAGRGDARLVTMLAPGVAGTSGGGLPPLTPMVLAGLGAVVLGCAALAWGSGRLRSAPLDPPLVLAGLALLLVGGAIAARGVAEGGSTASGGGASVNPFPPTEASLAAGAALYGQQCAVCHGPAGRGDGPQAAALNPRPVDLRQHVTAHPDAVLFGFMSDGVRGTAMPAYRETVAEEDRWNLLNFIKTFAGQP